MSMFKQESKLYPLIMTCFGALMFFIVGIILGYYLETAESAIIVFPAVFISVPIVSSLFLVLFGFLKKWEIIKFILFSEFFMLMVAFAESVLVFIFANWVDTHVNLDHNFKLLTIIGYILLVLPVYIIFGVFTANSIYGSEKRRFFATVYGVMGLLAGLIINLPMFNFTVDTVSKIVMIIIITSFGISLGYALGMSEYKRNTRQD